MPALRRNWLEPKVLGAIAAASSGLWLFVEVAGDVIKGDTRAIDTAILMAFRSSGDPSKPLGPDWFSEIVRDISGLGGAAVLGLLVATVTIYLMLSNRSQTALFVSVATLGGAFLSTLLKLGFDRPRPDVVPHLTYVHSASFPSGHAMMSAVVYLTLGALLARVVSGVWSKLFVMAVAAMLTGLIGVSRIYLGVHWPSDVLAGWAAGAAWALGWWVAAQIVNPGDGAEA